MAKFESKDWRTDKYRLFFVCPVTLTVAPTGKDGMGYKLTMPKMWAATYGPAIKCAIQVRALLVACRVHAACTLRCIPRRGHTCARR